MESHWYAIFLHETFNISIKSERLSISITVNVIRLGRTDFLRVVLELAISQSQPRIHSNTPGCAEEYVRATRASGSGNWSVRPSLTLSSCLSSNRSREVDGG